jgi:streptogramin lyase
MGHATVTAHRGPSARRGTRGQRVAAGIVVIGLIGAVALFSSGVLSHDAATHPGAAAFPKPTPVSATRSALTSIHAGRATGWALPEVASPRDVAVGADDVIWVTEQDTGKVDSFTGGTLTRHGTDVFPYLGAFSLGAGPDGAMWFSGYPGGSIARILPDGTANGFAPPSRRVRKARCGLRTAVEEASCGSHPPAPSRRSR